MDLGGLLGGCGCGGAVWVEDFVCGGGLCCGRHVDVE